MLHRNIPPSSLILAALVVGMITFVLLAEFLPRRDRDDDDSREPGLTVA